MIIMSALIPNVKTVAKVRRVTTTTIRHHAMTDSSVRQETFVRAASVRGIRKIAFVVMAQLVTEMRRVLRHRRRPLFRDWRQVVSEEETSTVLMTETCAMVRSIAMRASLEPERENAIIGIRLCVLLPSLLATQVQELAMSV
jgi:hypothetical protein